MKKLLVVDDEKEICDFLKCFFEDRNFEVQTANTGLDALKVMEKFIPHVVLLDLQMPGMDGIDTLAVIKREYPKIKVIMVTAIETQDKIEKAMRLGADNYITKPLNLDYLEKDVQEKLNHLAQL